MLSRSHVRMHVWERGAGRTLACGTGACATVVAGVLEGKTNRTCQVRMDLLLACLADAGRLPVPVMLLQRCSSVHETAPPSPAVPQVDLPGGPLHIEWRESDNHIYMTGPAELAFSGSVTV